MFQNASLNKEVNMQDRCASANQSDVKTICTDPVSIEETDGKEPCLKSKAGCMDSPSMKEADENGACLKTKNSFLRTLDRNDNHLDTAHLNTIRLDDIRLDDILLVGQQLPLGNSLTKNQELAQHFWRTFHKQLRMHHVLQGKHFVKYALTIRKDNQLYYACGVPSQQLYPDHFQLYCIPKGEYYRFKHRGPLSALSQTIRTIFTTLKQQNLIPWKQELVYFERYDEHFGFDAKDSIIEIYVPKAPLSLYPLEEIEAKSILQSGGTSIGAYSWFGMDYNMNLYKGCNHGCLYCDSRSSCYQVSEFDRVRIKKNELVLLEQELKRKRKKGVIGIGAMSDTYNPFEKQYEITRTALQLIDRYGFGVGLDTKSTLVLRDIDLLKQILQHSPCIIKLTITCADDALARIIEPQAPSSSERFLALEKLHQEGIYAGILMMPILPYINDTEENIRGIVQLAAKHHAKFIFPAFGMTLRDNQRDYYYYQLDQYFPGKRQLYAHRYRNTYSCDSPHAAKLYAIFKKECQAYGIRYRMKDIINGYKKPLIKQAQFQL